MTKKLFFLIVASLLFFSCSQQSKISKDFNCKTSSFKRLEEVKDIKKLFSIQIPKSWKTNLYYDDIQSSIYTADTTKQLTETLLLDITAINQNIKFDEAFKLKQEQENLSKKLIKTTSKETKILNKPSFYTISKGKKGKHNYQVCHFFIKTNEQKFILAKAEVYGDSLIKKRFCNALALIEKIKISN
ncbi:hypothetical protein [Polaribacter sp. Hel1_85]|uniref:hypothetical protein n=1 Tax=Polaribacter sp. Hel1_85 TaxID=1250005 RepID=UPI00052DC5CA|nr:hypothetical protein [Polaribacter sp. Hel1_85]KGL63512.1 hypothetical protein PHEL85_0548 [Polaribacter sp. Hel1_85]